jgi:hypothetical protein
LGIKEIVSSEIAGDVKIICATEFIVETVEGVQKIFQALDILYALKFSDSTGYVLAINLVDSPSDNRQRIFPSLFRKVNPFPKEGY